MTWANRNDARCGCCGKWRLREGMQTIGGVYWCADCVYHAYLGGHACAGTVVARNTAEARSGTPV